MKIGILTFYRVQNFGANLQAISTFFALKKRGHDPIFIHYETKEKTKILEGFENKSQEEAHYSLLDKYLPQTDKCCNVSDVNNVIRQHGIESIIIGSDAILQHHPFFSRLRRGRIRPFYLTSVTPERMFPNVFWGYGIKDNIPIAIMSGSSQNSEFHMFPKRLRREMRSALSRMKYISVRDAWTKKMIDSIFGENTPVTVTPDPVFAFNFNCPDIIPSLEEVQKRFNLPKKYVLFCLASQNLTETDLKKFKDRFKKEGYDCVAFPMPEGIKFNHPFDFEISLPLNPLDWYGIIQNASGYIGCNMHPIVVSLHNAVPCYSFDNWGTRDFWGNKKNDGSSKVLDIMDSFGVGDNHTYLERGSCDVEVEEVVKRIIGFPRDKVRIKCHEYLDRYNTMMDNICDILHAGIKNEGSVCI